MPKYSIPQARTHLKRNKSTDKSGFLVLSFRINGKQLTYSLSDYLANKKVVNRIEVKYWDSKQGLTVFNKKHDKDYIKVNKELRIIKDDVQKYLTNNPNVSFQELRLELDYYTGAKIRPEEKSKLPLFDFINKFIEDEQRNGKRGTWKKFITVRTHLENYTQENDIKLTYDSIDWEFRNKFLNWLYDAPRNHSTNNASKIFEVLKQFLQEAFKHRHHQNEIFKEKGFGVKRVKTKNKVRLTFDELKTVQKLDLSDNIPFDKVRDLFIVGCFTGLRFSDWHKVTKENIILDDGEELLDIFTQKTSKEVYIPLLPELKTILEKYDYQLPKLSSQYFNRTIKEVCEIAEIDSNEMRVYSESGATKEERLEKYKMVSSHCARRSFASNFYDLGIPAFMLMQVTGHATEKQFFEYIDLSKKDLAKKFAKQARLARKTKLKVAK